MKIAVIGAGPSGLVSAKHCLSEGYEVDVFEQNRMIGGVWVYTNDVGTDKYGFPVHSAMYKGLRTNAPKEIMSFSGHVYSKELKRSYITSLEVLDYFNSYADKFDLRRHIKCNTRVIEVKPTENQKWNIKTMNLLEETTMSGSYDAVMICTGHFCYAYEPQFPGKEKFRGIQIHSHDYRSPELFKDKRCLIVGFSYSGRDIAEKLLEVTNKIFVIQKKQQNDLIILKRVTEKPEILEIYENSVKFKDGTTEEIDAIIYCTGYNFHYPFLSDDCGIVVEKGKWVRPLYKQIINIERPTMCFIGLQSFVAIIPLLELQVRFFMATLNGHFPLPSKEHMYDDLRKEVETKKARGITTEHMHDIGGAAEQEVLFEDIAKTANIKGVPPVIHKIYAECRYLLATGKAADCLFEIVDDESFRQTFLK